MRHPLLQIPPIVNPCGVCDIALGMVQEHVDQYQHRSRRSFYRPRGGFERMEPSDSFGPVGPQVNLPAGDGSVEVLAALPAPDRRFAWHPCPLSGRNRAENRATSQHQPAFELLLPKCSNTCKSFSKNDLGQY